jgi:hypothetical protein
MDLGGECLGVPCPFLKFFANLSWTYQEPKASTDAGLHTLKKIKIAKNKTQFIDFS